MLYKNIIFTDHALSRIRQRNLDVKDVYQTISYPEKVIDLEKNKKKYLKTLGSRRVQVVAAPASEANKKLVVSVWVRGENDKPMLLIQVLSSIKNLFIWVLKKIF